MSVVIRANSGRYMNGRLIWEYGINSPEIFDLVKLLGCIPTEKFRSYVQRKAFYEQKKLERQRKVTQEELREPEAVLPEFYFSLTNEKLGLTPRLRTSYFAAEYIEGDDGRFLIISPSKDHSSVNEKSAYDLAKILYEYLENLLRNKKELNLSVSLKA